MSKRGFDKLRTKAEEKLAENDLKTSGMGRSDLKSLTHELAVHQIELEIQNEELRQSRAAAEEVRDRYLDLFDFAPVGYFTLDGHSKIIEANLTGCTLLGLDRRAIKNKPFTRFVSDDETDNFYLYRKKILENDAKQASTLKMKKADDTSFYAQLEGIKTGEGILHMAVSDITERKNMEESLNQSEKLYHSLFENMIDGYAFCQMLYENGRPHDFIYLSVNNAFEKLTGLKNVVGKRVTEVIPGIKESNPEIFEIYGRVALTCESERFELYLPPLARWFLISVYCTQKEYFVAVFENITERKLAEEALKNTLKNLEALTNETSALLKGARAVLNNKEFPDTARSIFDFCKDLIRATAGYVSLLNKEGTANDIVFLDAGGRPCDVDPALPMPIRGLRAEAYGLGKPVYDNNFAKSNWMNFIPENHVTLDNVLFAPLILQGKVFGLIGLANKVGGFTDNDAQISAAFADLAAIALQNSRTLELLESSERNLKQAQSIGKMGSWEFDLLTERIEWSDEVYKLYEREKSLGPPSTEEEASYYLPEESLRLKELASRTMQNGEENQHNVVAQLPSGKKLHLHTQMLPVKDVTGKVIKIFGTVQDITDSKLAQEKIDTFNAALIQHSNELEATNKELESFSYSISHDLKAPLRSIDGFSRIVLEDYSDKVDAQGQEYLQRISSSSKLMSQLIDDILNLSRITQTEIHLEKVDLTQLAEEVVGSAAIHTLCWGI
jgi:PAS domain S-box-containing protein